MADSLGDIMIAKLGPLSLVHPDSVRMLLEALALWHRARIRVVMRAECERQLESSGLTDGFGLGVDTLTPPAKTGDGALGGLPASGGVYRGKARVIRSTSDLHTLKKGEVLVCPTTCAAWMMVFARAGALAAETGSFLSHTAIVAREHSLPAVVGVADALAAIRTGDEVIVDGHKGTVTLVQLD